ECEVRQVTCGMGLESDSSDDGSNGPARRSRNHQSRTIGPSQPESLSEVRGVYMDATLLDLKNADLCLPHPGAQRFAMEGQLLANLECGREGRAAALIPR